MRSQQTWQTSGEEWDDERGPEKSVGVEWVWSSMWTIYEVPRPRGETESAQTAETSGCFSKCICNNIGLKWVNVSSRSVQFSGSVMSDSLQPHGLQHTRPPCPSPTPGACSNSCPSSWLCRPTISSSVVPFSSCLQSFPASGSFQMSQFFASGGQSIKVSASASVLPMNIQDYFPLGWTGLICLQSKGLSRVFSNTIVKKHQFLSAQLSL